MSIHASERKLSEFGFKSWNEKWIWWTTFFVDQRQWNRKQTLKGNFFVMWRELNNLSHMCVEAQIINLFGLGVKKIGSNLQVDQIYVSIALCWLGGKNGHSTRFFTWKSLLVFIFFLETIKHQACGFVFSDN